MKLNKLNFEIVINAPVEKVWDKMLSDEGYREWTTEFNPLGSWYEGSLEEGNKVLFMGKMEDGTTGGMNSEIAVNKKYEYLSIRHLGYTMNGVVVTDTPEFKSFFPSYENYTFERVDDNSTKLMVYMDSDPQYTEMFSAMWPKALAKLKEICEK